MFQLLPGLRTRGLIVHAACVMSTHYHGIFEGRTARLSAAMHWLNWSYARAYNTTHDLHGHVFSERFQTRFDRRRGQSRSASCVRPCQPAPSWSLRNARRLALEPQQIHPCAAALLARGASPKRGSSRSEARSASSGRYAASDGSPSSAAWRCSNAASVSPSSASAQVEVVVEGARVVVAVDRVEQDALRLLRVPTVEQREDVAVRLPRLSAERFARLGADCGAPSCPPHGRPRLVSPPGRGRRRSCRRGRRPRRLRP